MQKKRVQAGSTSAAERPAPKAAVSSKLKYPPVRPVEAASYSRLSMYDWCPQQVRFSVVMGLKQPSSPQMERGNVSHKTMERFLKQTGTAPPKLPKEYEHLKPVLSEIRKHGSPRVEEQFAYDAAWRPVPYFDKSVRWRMKVDLRYEHEEGCVRLVDFKTGKIKPEEHAEQIDLYVLVELLQAKRAAFPGRVETAVYYIDHEPDMRVMKVYDGPDAGTLKQLKAYWERRAKPLLTDTQLKPTPSEGKCGWCAYSRHKGGPCQAAAA